MIYGLVLKLHRNNHPDQLSLSEEIHVLHKSVDKTGVTENDSRRT